MIDRGGIRRTLAIGGVAMATVAGLALAVGVTGAGAGGDSSAITLTQSDEDTGATDERRERREERREEFRAQAEEWRECVEAEGVDLPEIERDDDGRPVGPKPELTDEQREEIRAAAEECGRPPGHRIRRAFRAGAAGDARPADAPATDRDAVRLRVA